jgi:uncharacterized protein (UPF0248 family)
VKEANAEHLHQDFAKIRFKPSESIEDFSIRITSIINELRVLVDEITNKEVVKKMLHSVPKKPEQVSISIYMFLDLHSLSIEEATCHLRAIEQRTTWMKCKEKGGSNNNGGFGGSRRGKGRGKNKSCGGRRNGGANSNSHEGGEDGVSRGACENYGKIGH